MISAVLRTLAAHLEDTADDCFEGSNSPYICDNLVSLCPSFWSGHGFDGADLYCALQFLRYLGMGVGFREFLLPSESLSHFHAEGPEDFLRDVQSRRVAWLLFAADLADEWGVRDMRDFTRDE